MSRIAESPPATTMENVEPDYRRQRCMVKKLTLLNRLVRTSIFQFLTGNLNWRKIGKPRKAEPGKQYVNVEQSLHEQLQDLVIFTVLLIASPFYGANRFLSRTLLRSYWPRFAFGVVCGFACLFLVYTVVETFVSRFVST